MKSVNRSERGYGSQGRGTLPVSYRPDPLRVFPVAGALWADIVHGHGQGHQDDEGAHTAHRDVEDVRRRRDAPLAGLTLEICKSKQFVFVWG